MGLAKTELPLGCHEHRGAAAAVGQAARAARPLDIALVVDAPFDGDLDRPAREQLGGKVCRAARVGEPARATHVCDRGGDGAG